MAKVIYQPDKSGWITYDAATDTVRTKDGTVVARMLFDTTQCLADVLHIAQIRHNQRNNKYT